MGACCHSYKHNWCWLIDITQIQRTELPPILRVSSVFDFSLIIMNAKKKLRIVYIQQVSL